MKKKMLSVLLSMCMVICLFNGCGNDAENGPSESTDASKEEQTGKEEQSAQTPVDITWLGYYTSNMTVAADSWAERLLEDTFPVNITPVTDVTHESFDGYLASGDIMDVTCFETYIMGTMEMQYLYDQGIIREIPEEWLYEYFPTGMKYYTDFLGEDFFQDGWHKVDGKVLCTPYNQNQNTSESCMVYRTDWLKKLGLKEPSTLEELHDMLYAFTYDDPDGNGADDTYGTSFLWSSTSNILWPVFGAFGIAFPDSYCLNEDGTVTYNAASGEYREALRVLKKWYEEGIIDPECITDDRSAMRTKWSNGTLGAMCDNQTWCFDSRGNASVINMVESVYGENTVDVLGPLTTEYGDGTVYSGVNTPGAFSNKALCFTANATDEQVIAVLKMLEGMSADDELMTKLLYGEEGVDYTLDGDGRMTISNGITVEYQASRGIDTYYSCGAQSPKVVSIALSERDLARREKIEAQKTVYIKGNIPGGTKNEALIQYSEEVVKIVKEYLYAVLLENDDLDSGWDNYTGKLSAAGLDKIIAEYENVLK